MQIRLLLMVLLLRMCLFERKGLACRAALATGDFEAAAEHVSKYLQLDKHFSDVSDELDSHQLQEQRAVCPLSSHAPSAAVSVHANSSHAASFTHGRLRECELKPHCLHDT